MIDFMIDSRQLLLCVEISMETETRRKDKNKRDYV